MFKKKSQLFDICILCALPEEVQGVLDVVSTKNQPIEQQYSKTGRFGYFSTTVKNRYHETLTLHISFPPAPGLIETSLHLQTVLKECQPSFVAMTGICAGDRRKVKIGDLVIADRAFLYDAGKVVKSQHGLYMTHNIKTYNTDIHVLQALHMFNPQWSNIWHAQQKNAVFSQQHQRLRPERRCISKTLLSRSHAHETFFKQENAVSTMLSRDNIFRSQCHIAPLASGNAVRTDNPFHDIQSVVREAIALDMEGAAFYRIASEFPGTPSLLVKGISDYADEEKNDSYRRYASLLSAAYVVCFIQEHVRKRRKSVYQQATSLL